MRTFVGIWMACTFAWKARCYELELGEGGWLKYFAQYTAAAIHSLWPAVGLWLLLGRWL